MRGRSARGSIWLALIACVVLQPATGAKPAPDLSGSWVRDPRASDDPVEKAEAQNVQTGAPRRRPWGISFPGGVWYPGSGRGRGGGGGGAGGGPGALPARHTGQRPARRRSGRRAAVPMAAGRQLADRPAAEAPGGGRGGGGAGRGGRTVAAPEVEHIARGVEAIKIEHREPQLTVRDANGETRVLFTDGRVVGDGIGTKTVAVWRGDTLEVDTRGSLGSKSETWSLDGDQLTVTTAFDLGRGGGFTFTTVYDRVEGSERAGDDDAGSSRGGRCCSGAARRGASDRLARTSPTADAARRPDRDESEPTQPDFDEPADESRAGISKIRLLPPPPKPGGGLLSGKVAFDTLTIDPEVAVVEFYLDGERVSRRAWPPFETKLTLADPPREQVVRAVALAANDRVLGEDSLVVNRVDPPFRVRIASIARTTGGALEVRADVSLPRRAELERVAFFLGDRPLGEMTRPPFVARVEAADVDPEAFVRVVATLRDGRERENVALLDEKVFVEHVDVRMVELQLVVTDRTGTAVGGLGVEDFEVIEGEQTHRPEHLYPAERVGLLLGLAIDSSGSMWPLWDQTRSAARYFLDHTLRERDRAFLVDFDSELRLIEPPTADRQSLAWGLERLSPHGGTVLYDSILFSMLQYEGEHGRRALIVLTDGVDSESRSDPRRAIEFGRRLGVPVYVIALSGVPGAAASGPGWQHSSARTTAALEEAAARNELRLITDPTGGRLFNVVTAEQMSRAFAEIQEELHRQYVLTYYTERQPGEGGAPEVRVKRAGASRCAAPCRSSPSSSALHSCGRAPATASLVRLRVDDRLVRQALAGEPRLARRAAAAVLDHPDHDQVLLRVDAEPGAADAVPPVLALRQRVIGGAVGPLDDREVDAERVAGVADHRVDLGDRTREAGWCASASPSRASGSACRRARRRSPASARSGCSPSRSRPGRRHRRRTWPRSGTRPCPGSPACRPCRGRRAATAAPAFSGGTQNAVSFMPSGSKIVSFRYWSNGLPESTSTR